MAKDKITQKDVIDDSVIKSITVLNKELQESVKLMTELSRTAIDLNKNFNPQNLNDITTSTESYNKANKESQEANKDAADTLDKLQQKIDQVNKEEEELKMELQKRRKEVRENIKAEKDQANSINDLNRRIAKLRSAAKSVNTTTKQGRDQIKQYNKEINKLTAQVTAASDNFTKQKRNIGNYSSALSGLPGGFGNAVRGAQGFGNTLKAIGAIPIVAVITGIVLALTGLVKLFKSTDDGGTKLEATTNGLKAVFQVFKGVLLDVIEGTKARFERFAKQWELLKERIKGNDERVAELRKEIEELSDVIEGNKPFENLGERAKAAFDAVYQLTFQMDALNDRIIASISSQKELELEMEKYITLSKDQTLSDEERISALERGLSVAQEFYGNQRKFAEENFNNEIEIEAARREVSAETLRQLIKMNGEEAENARATNEEIARIWNESGDDRIKALEEMYVKFLQSDIDYEKKTSRIISQLSGLQKRVSNDNVEAKRLEYETLNELTATQIEVELETEAERFDKITELQMEKIAERNAKEEELRQQDIENQKLADEAKKESYKSYVTFATSQAQQLSNSIFGYISSELDYQLQADIEKARSRGASEAEIEQIEKDAAEKRKNVRLTQAIINTALGVTNALATASSWIEGVIAAVLVGAMGALEIATIESASFYTGTKDSGSGWLDATVGERGVEKINLADGRSFYTPNGPTKMLLPPHSEVVPNHRLQQELAEMQSYGSKRNQYQDNQLSKEQHNELIKTIKNKKETTLNITENGVSVTAKKGNNFYKYIDRKYRE